MSHSYVTWAKTTPPQKKPENINPELSVVYLIYFLSNP